MSKASAISDLHGCLVGFLQDELDRYRGRIGAHTLVRLGQGESHIDAHFDNGDCVQVVLKPWHGLPHPVPAQEREPVMMSGNATDAIVTKLWEGCFSFFDPLAGYSETRERCLLIKWRGFRATFPYLPADAILAAGLDYALIGCYAGSKLEARLGKILWDSAN